MLECTQTLSHAHAMLVNYEQLCQLGFLVNTMLNLYVFLSVGMLNCAQIIAPDPVMLVNSR
jgi:hypothetical protein